MELTKLPLEERLKQISQSKPVSMPLQSISYAGFFEGVSLLAKTKYPEWLRKQLEDYYTAQPNTPFLLMVNHAQKLINHYQEKAASPCGNSGYELMFQLLIEPFSLINQADKEAKSK